MLPHIIYFESAGSSWQTLIRFAKVRTISKYVISISRYNIAILFDGTNSPPSGVFGDYVMIPTPRHQMMDHQQSHPTPPLITSHTATLNGFCIFLMSMPYKGEDHQDDIRLNQL